MELEQSTKDTYDALEVRFHNLPEVEIPSNVSSLIAGRANQLLQRRCIALIKFNVETIPYGIAAIVYASQKSKNKFRLWMELEGKTVANSECTCAIGKLPNLCVHRIAVLLALDQIKKGIVDKEWNKKKLAPVAPARPSGFFPVAKLMERKQNMLKWRKERPLWRDLIKDNPFSFLPKLKLKRQYSQTPIHISPVGLKNQSEFCKKTGLQEYIC